MEKTIEYCECNWDLAVKNTKEELECLKLLEGIYGHTIIIMMRESILEECLKMYQKGQRDEGLYSLMLGVHNPGGL